MEFQASLRSEILNNKEEKGNRGWKKKMAKVY